MKKSVIITIIVSVILLFVIMCVFVVGVIFNLAKPREALTSEEFETIMEDKAYEVVDVKEIQFDEYDYIENVILAIDDGYQFEFYSFINEEYASRFFLKCKESFELEKEDMSTMTTVNFSNGSKYALSTDGKYKVITRIGSTVLYLDVDEIYQNEVKAVLDEINY